MVEHLYIYEPEFLPSGWQDDIESMQWREILQPFTAVKKLYLCKTFEQCIITALQDLLEERVTDVLPALESLFLGDLRLEPVQKAIAKFFVARRLSGRPITLSIWKNDLKPVVYVI